ncbi:EAL domain-containing protein [Vibrio sp. Of7-15]|uniref:EAL domain-containing protein n=1 Tax=Vibrio sp. Of7-15 TaxID=2724879 RepID=UPI001EF1D1C3|nr:EAL domain-containing protein [Vibrio sp. Of7-15]MCG7497847.1 EAL domain-containing protein [Vibrio sp. Of7-15]
MKSLSWTIVSPAIIIALLCTLFFSLASPFVLERFAKEIAIDNAQNLVSTFRNVRNYFSTHVINKVVENGNFHITPMHKDDEFGVPVPATFLMEMVENDTHITTSLSSPYPFKNRMDRIQDDFQKRAWSALSDKADDFYVELIRKNNSTIVRVAQADRLSAQACVDCHNNHPYSLRNDWELNDVRGLLEVNTVVDGWLERGAMVSKSLTIITLLGLIIIMFINYRVARKVSTPLGKITDSLSLLAQGKDTDIKEVSGDYQEIAELQHAFNGLHKKEQQRRCLIKEVEHLAYFDPLTNLANRTGFITSLDQLLVAEKAQNGDVSVLLIDIDRFRDVNNTLGYDAGDAILISVAKRLSALVPADGLLARLGEDKYAVALPRRAHSGCQGIDPFINTVMDAISTEIVWQERTVKLMLNIGVSCSSHDAQHGDDMLIQANIALHAAKAKGKNQAVRHIPELSQMARQRVDLVKQITQAIDNNEFVPFYQPQFCAETGRIIGAEALMRWKKQDGSLISPGEFIPLAEQSHLILPMGTKIFENACLDCQGWQQYSALKGVRVAVNVSSVQFANQDILQLTNNMLTKTNISPNLVELEVTESAMLGDLSKVISILEQLKQLGVEIALDDFGTGYSSLSYLKSLPIDRLKIDREFVKDLLNNPTDQAILSMICNLGRDLSLKVLAEGVENKHQLDMLKKSGCEEVQGFYFAKPMPLEEFIAFAVSYQNKLASGTTSL